ncbi:hypothetical protein FLONG3_9830 [Fusarium longipes]|uniref:Uncharacterized protein n=1 Tax=Fusarium longipes TaxID=694270 RepID=A0A395RU73_9HYPO|nr:hypothetical protein FLONG3_9830 [Fusarium longipes]
MKSTFFALFALAASAIASPVPQPELVGGAVDGVVKTVVGGEDTTGLVGGLLKGAKTPSTGLPVKRDITDVTQLLSVLQGGVDGAKSQTSGFSDIAKQVKAGDITKSEGADLAIPGLEGLNDELTHIVTELTGAAGLTTSDADVQKVLGLVTILVNIVLTAVKTIVTVTGLQPQLVSILHSVFQILAKVLTLVIGLVAGILPGLIAALTPLLAGLGVGVLSPVLAPITALLAGLGAGI